jgi:hypothetical protein
MAEPKQRQRPKGYEIRKSLKPKPMQKKPSGKGYAASGALGATAAATAADMVGATDPYLSRNEFKPGFYEQLAQKTDHFTDSIIQHAKSKSYPFSNPLLYQAYPDGYDCALYSFG